MVMSGVTPQLDVGRGNRSSREPGLVATMVRMGLTPQPPSRHGKGE
jgi:hypothetical protein